MPKIHTKDDKRKSLFPGYTKSPVSVSVFWSSCDTRHYFSHVQLCIAVSYCYMYQLSIYLLQLRDKIYD